MVVPHVASGVQVVAKESHGPVAVLHGMVLHMDIGVQVVAKESHGPAAVSHGMVMHVDMGVHDVMDQQSGGLGGSLHGVQSVVRTTSVVVVQDVVGGHRTVEVMVTVTVP